MNDIRSTIQLSNEYGSIGIGDRVFEVGSVEWSNPSRPNEGEAMIHLRGDYEGYWMSIGYESGLMNGRGVLYRPNHLIMLEAWFVRGICEGEVIERDENGEVILKYEMKSGVKSGYEYGYVGNEVVRIELYEGGVLKWKSILNEEMSGYWNVYGSNDELLYVCEREKDLKRMNGICFEYEGGKVLKRKCVYENDELKGVLCEWKGEVMVVYREDGSRVYEGGYVYSEDGYVRNGYGKEYGEDGNSVKYSGHWEEGKKSGYGSWYVGGVIRYNGEWLNDEPNGEGSLFDENGVLLNKGKWMNGVLRVDGREIDYRTKMEKKNDHSWTQSNHDNSSDAYEENSWASHCILLIDYLYGGFIAFTYDSFIIVPIGEGVYFCTIAYCILSIAFLLLHSYQRCPIHLILVDFIFLFATLHIGDNVGRTEDCLLSIICFGLGYAFMIYVFYTCGCAGYMFCMIAYLYLSTCCVLSAYEELNWKHSIKDTPSLLGMLTSSSLGIVVIEPLFHSDSSSNLLLCNVYYYYFSILLVLIYSYLNRTVIVLSTVYMMIRIVYWCYAYIVMKSN